MASTLSLIIPTRNCADRLPLVVNPWKGIVRETIIVDQFSTDGTAEVAKSLGCIVLQNEPPNGNFNVNRKLGMEKASSDWLLYLDSDEVPTDELLDELKAFLGDPARQNGVQGVRIPNLFYFLGKPLQHGLYDKKSAELRMFRQGAWEYPAEKGIHYGVHLKDRNKWIRFKNPYRHFNVNGLSEWFLKTNQYTEHDSARAGEQGRAPLTYKSFWLAMRFFVRHYFLKLGFLDGYRGLLSVVYYMLYHFTERAKIWEFTERKKWVEGRDYLKPIPLPKR